MHATFLKQNDFYTPSARWHVFLFSINVNKNENTNHFRQFLMGAVILFQKSTLYLTASLRCHRQSDVNIDQSVFSLLNYNSLYYVASENKGILN